MFHVNVGRLDRHESLVASRNGIAVTIFLSVSDEQILGFFNELLERCFGRFHVWGFFLSGLIPFDVDIKTDPQIS